MASWYASSVAYAAVAQFAALTSYSVGNIVRQLAAPAAGNERCFRCTTAGISGASEPSWNLSKGATTVSATATFTEVTGNSTYSWSAPSISITLMLGGSWAASGDTVYVASDHNYSIAGNLNYNIGTLILPCLVVCVNPAGSVPPVAADVTTGAVETTSLTTNVNGVAVWDGIKLESSRSSSNTLTLAGPYNQFLNCILSVSANASLALSINNSATADLVNTPVSFGNAASFINIQQGKLTWRNTLSALAGTVPTTKLFGGNLQNAWVLLDGVDLASMSSGALVLNASGNYNCQISFVNCKLNAGVTIATLNGAANTGVDLIISDSTNTGYRQERRTIEGTLSAETTFVLTGGASDGVTPISWKVVTTSSNNILVPFECFPIAVWNTSTSPVTATVEIESNATLTNADVWLEVETLDTSGFPISALHSSALATPLTTAANLPTSSATWAGGLGSAVKQYLQVTFTPALAGYVRGAVKVGKASQTLYINPQITLT